MFLLAITLYNETFILGDTFVMKVCHMSNAVFISDVRRGVTVAQRERGEGRLLIVTAGRADTCFHHSQGRSFPSAAV